jgi:hypothetical protein
MAASSHRTPAISGSSAASRGSVANLAYWKTNGKRRITNMSGEWISVSERYPEEDEDVLVFSTDGMQDIRLAQMASFDGIMWRFCDMDDDDVDSFGITHWMPLPAPPTDGK